MSGIYINGLEMPTSCPCELIGIGYDLCCSFVWGIPARVKEYYECCQNDTRPSWCPLIPVPDHGDLIDRDALCERLEKAAEIKPYLNGMNAAISFALLAPTIIPADKEDEQG